MNIPSHYSPAEAQAFLRRQISTGKYMVLGTVIITVVNLVFLLCNVDFYISYSAALAYYPVWLGKGFDNEGMLEWTKNGEYTLTGLVIGMVVLAALLLLWLLSRNDIRWLKVSVGFLAVDTVAVILLAVGLWENFYDCLFEVVIHGAVIWEMCRALSAHKQLRALKRAERSASRQEAWEPLPDMEEE